MVKFNCEIINHEDYRKGIIDLYPEYLKRYQMKPILSNPYGMVQYISTEIFDNILLFPIKITYNGLDAGFTCVYNISDTHIRMDGIYIRYDFRGKGLVKHMVKYAASLWPEPWDTMVGWLNDSAFRSLEGIGWRKSRLIAEGSPKYGSQILEVPVHRFCYWKFRNDDFNKTGKGENNASL